MTQLNGGRHLADDLKSANDVYVFSFILILVLMLLDARRAPSSPPFSLNL